MRQIVVDEVHEAQAPPGVIFQQWPRGEEGIRNAVHHGAQILHSLLHESKELCVDLLNVFFAIGLQEVGRESGQQLMFPFLPIVGTAGATYQRSRREREREKKNLLFIKKNTVKK